MYSASGSHNCSSAFCRLIQVTCLSRISIWIKEDVSMTRTGSIFTRSLPGETPIIFLSTDCLDISDKKRTAAWIPGLTGSFLYHYKLCSLSFSSLFLTHILPFGQLFTRLNLIIPLQASSLHTTILRQSLSHRYSQHQSTWLSSHAILQDLSFVIVDWELFKMEFLPSEILDLVSISDTCF